MLRDRRVDAGAEEREAGPAPRPKLRWCQVCRDRCWPSAQDCLPFSEEARQSHNRLGDLLLSVLYVECFQIHIFELQSTGST